MARAGEDDGNPCAAQLADEPELVLVRLDAADVRNARPLQWTPRGREPALIDRVRYDVHRRADTEVVSYLLGFNPRVREQEIGGLEGKGGGIEALPQAACRLVDASSSWSRTRRVRRTRDDGSAEAAFLRSSGIRRSTR